MDSWRDASVSILSRCTVRMENLEDGLRSPGPLNQRGAGHAVPFPLTREGNLKAAAGYLRMFPRHALGTASLSVFDCLHNSPVVFERNAHQFRRARGTVARKDQRTGPRKWQ